MSKRHPNYGDHFDIQLYNFDTALKLCKNHIEDDFIIGYIKTNGQIGKCDYCNKKIKVTALTEILELIVIGIDYLYEDPVNSRYLNKDSEYGYDGNVFGFYELWRNLDLDITDNKLEEDIYSYLENDSLYCERNEYTSQEEYLDELWNLFKNTVKYKARFVFHFKEIFTNYLYADPINILDQVQDSILSLSLFKNLPAKTRLYRCRQHDAVEPVKEATHMASTPQHLSRINGRMNPAGISMFYSSKNKDLTIKEVVDINDTSKPYYSTAIFTTQNSLKLVDLTKIPKFPSIFDDLNNQYIEELAFLRNFIDDITKPVSPNDLIIEYIPTQIVTEYIRFNPNLNVDGIIYPSSKDKSFDNIVLFYDHDESLQKLSFSRNSIKRNTI